jgi:uncharacterized membrane protein
MHATAGQQALQPQEADWAGSIHGATASLVAAAVLMFAIGAWLEQLSRYDWPVPDHRLQLTPAAVAITLLLGWFAAARSERARRRRRNAAAALLVGGLVMILYCWAVGDPPDLVAGLFLVGAGIAALADRRTGAARDESRVEGPRDLWPAGLLILAALAILMTFITAQAVENHALAISVDCYDACDEMNREIAANNAQLLPWLIPAAACLLIAPFTANRRRRPGPLSLILALMGGAMLWAAWHATDPFLHEFGGRPGLLPETASLWLPAALILAAAARIVLRTTAPRPAEAPPQQSSDVIPLDGDRG